MRTRLIRPAFWADATVAGLPVAVRLTFMGLWGLSDDDGYFDWRPSEIAAELYRYAPAASRLRQVTAHLNRLTETGRVLELKCGRHGLIPSMPTHRIQSGRHTFPTRLNHESTCIEGRGIPRPLGSRSESGRNGSDALRIGSVRDASARGELSTVGRTA